MKRAKVFFIVFLIYLSVYISIAFSFNSSIETPNYPFYPDEVNKKVSLNRQHGRHNPNADSLIPASKQCFSKLKQPQKISCQQVEEFLIDTNIVFVPAPNNQSPLSVAFDGTNYLIVWEDHRNYLNDIYGTRVNRAGIILDPAGIIISDVSGNAVKPAIAFDGLNYLVVWQDFRNGSWDIYGTRINQSGVILDTNGFAVSTAADAQLSPAIAFDGTNYLVAWEDYRNYSPSNLIDIYGARISQSGNVLDSSGIAISTATNNQESPAISFDGVNYLVVWKNRLDWTSEYDIYGTFINQLGMIIDTAVIKISTAPKNQREPAVAFDGINYLVVWHDSRNGSDYGIYGARVNRYGIVLDSSGITVSNEINHQVLPTISFDGTNFLVTWQDNRNGNWDIYCTRISQSGTILDSLSLIISTANNDQGNPRLSFDGTNYLVVWADGRNGTSDIYGARINQNIEILDPSGIIVSTAANDQIAPSVAYDGSNYLVVWQDFHSGSWDIYGARISRYGSVIDPVTIEISTAPGDQLHPVVAFDSTNYLIVWQDSRNGTDNYDIYGTRLTIEGEVLDPTGIPISTAINNQNSPSIAFEGTSYLVVWQDGRNTSGDIYGARVTLSGAVLDPNGIAISTTIEGQENPSVAFDSTNYLVVWNDWRSGYDWSAIYAARVTKSGAVLDTLGFFVGVGGHWTSVAPSISFDGTNYLIVWESGCPASIYGARITKNGTVLDSTGFPITLAPDFKVCNPNVTFDGTNFFVSWEDYRNNFAYSDIYGAKVNYLGIVIDSFAISIQEGNQCSPTMVLGQTDKMLISYYGWTGVVQGKPYNTPYRIWAKFFPSHPITFAVYPGDCNNDGVVNAIDVLSIGRSWHFTGNPRDTITTLWFPWITFPWSISEATYADCNGDGEINEQDVLAIGLNWHKNHTLNGEKFIINLENPELKNYIDNYKAIYNSIKGEDEATQEIKKVLIAIINKYSQLGQSFLSQIFPNPVISQCKIRFGLSKTSKVDLKIYDISGQLVKTLIDGLLESGHHIGSWDGRDTKGRKVSNGIYLYRLTTNDFECTRSLIVLR